jgi:hypothetical protein
MEELSKKELNAFRQTAPALVEAYEALKKDYYNLYKMHAVACADVSEMDDRIHELSLALYNCRGCKNEGDKIIVIVERAIGGKGLPQSFKPLEGDAIL